MRAVKLKYGKGSIEVFPPGGLDFSVLEPAGGEVLPDPRGALSSGLRAPSGSASLESLAAAASRACIVVSDKTRFVPYRVILPEILDILERKKTEVFFLIASGMHAPSSPEDIIEILGEDAAGKYEVISHRAEEESELVYLGAGGCGIPVHVNRRYYEADLKLLTGFIEPHFMAGFSGGRKSICPGISGLETIKFVHSAKILSSRFSGAGILSENPVNDAMFEAADLAGCDFIVNVTLDEDKEITGIFCGGLREAFAEGAAACARQCRTSCEGGFDLVVTTGGGYPLDRDFYQTVKGLVGALNIIKPGGTIICASECSDGLGSGNFRELLGMMRFPAQFMDMLLSEGFFRPDQWEVQELVKVLEKCRVKIYSGNLSDEEISQCGCEPVKDLNAEIIRASGPGLRAAFIPQGPYALCG